VTMGGSTGDFDHDTWELYKLVDDFSEANDVSADYPQKLRELQDNSGSRQRSTTSFPSTTASPSVGDPACDQA